MAMSGRIRSALPLLNRVLRSDAAVSQRAVLTPAFTATSPSSEFAKNYSAKAGTTEAKVKVPVTLFGGSGNYASALYVAAKKANALDKVEAEFLDFVEASKRSPTFSLFMKDLSVPVGTRVKALTEIATEAKLSDITKNFLVLVAENGRLRNLEIIAKKFVELTRADKGIVKAVVTAVEPLAPQEEQELKETLQDILGHGKKVILEQKIDANILGGIVVEFGEKVLDMSIRARAQQMERLLSQPVDLF
ncbi:hypothetical protein Tsubulata_002271 [Turnera subulata]|uniref:ATP synthase subunit O, mitochondrial n=1 Tax=Turnera subulata TaxID=218843 RepID=A0A9Q0JGB7_9ROSI|nr:hypothetical protein Tsubulata_002271 [Turnera subulata]